MARGVRGFLAVLALAAATVGSALPAAAAGFVVIVNKDVKVDSLSKQELQAIFLGEKVKWDKAFYIKVVMPEEQGVVREFLQAVVGKSPSQFDTHWSKLTFTGRAVPPPTLPEISEVVDYVATHRGAISFVPSGKAGNTVKTIAIR